MRLRKVKASVTTNLSRISLLAAGLFALTTFCFAQATMKTSPPSTLRHYDIKVADLPPPEVLTGPRNQSRVIPKPEGAQLTLPPGFRIDVFAEGDLQQPRSMALAANGDVFVSESQANRVSILRDSNGDGRVDERFVFATGLTRP